MNIKQTEFSTWLESKFIDWMVQTGKRRKTLTAFAEWVGVSPSMMTRYMHGTMCPTGENVKKIAEKLGVEIYDLLGLARPDEEAQALVSLFGRLDSPHRTRLLAFAQQFLTEQEASR